MRRFWVIVALIVVVWLVVETLLMPGPVMAPGPNEVPRSTLTAAGTITATPERATSILPTAISSPAWPTTLSPSPTTTLTSTKPSAEEMLQIIKASDLPERDLYDLAKRARAKNDGDIPRLASPQPPGQVGRRDVFYINDQAARKYFTVTATLQLITPHAYFYVEDGATVSQERLKQVGDAFESKIYPTVHTFFGTEWTPGIDNDPHITILNARIPGADGYYISADEYTKQVHPFSNEREIIYVSLGTLLLGGDSYEATLAHELQHMVHWNMRPREDAWVNEGAAELAMRLIGRQTSGGQGSFLSNPDIQLNDWAEEPSETVAHYAAAYLFLSYLAERCGGYETLKEVIAQEGSGLERFDRYLAGKSLSFDELFADWTVANYLDDPSANDGRYGYRDIDARVTAIQAQNELGELTATVHQYAADYIALKPPISDFEVVFDGADTVKVVPNDPRSGEMQWWSNRGDLIDTSLTKAFDLSGFQKPLLRFWTWYDIEKSFDFAYVMVSNDNGRTWKTMRGRYTTSSNPLGANLGDGYTGVSGGGAEPRWVEEEIDLSSFAGQRVLIRFEYITDDVYTGNGFCIDDVTVDGSGIIDSVEADDGWEARGFLRLRNSIPQRFVVRLVTKRGGYDVQTVALDAQNRGRITVRGLGQDVESATLVIAATSPGTTQPARYVCRLEPVGR